LQKFSLQELKTKTIAISNPSSRTIGGLSVEYANDLDPPCDSGSSICSGRFGTSDLDSGFRRNDD